MPLSLFISCCGDENNLKNDITCVWLYIFVYDNNNVYIIMPRK